MKQFIVILSALFSFAAIAHADFDVSVNANGQQIVCPGLFHGDTPKNFVDSIAAVRTYSPDSGGVFFARGENFIARLKRDGYKVYGMPTRGVRTNVGAVYFVIAMNLTADGEKIALVSPVNFSAFGVGIDGPDGEVYHTGTVDFDDAWINAIRQDKYKM